MTFKETREKIQHLFTFELNYQLYQ